MPPAPIVLPSMGARVAVEAKSVAGYSANGGYLPANSGFQVHSIFVVLAAAWPKAHETESDAAKSNVSGLLGQSLGLPLSALRGLGELPRLIRRVRR